jgi:hypothetical protein
VKFFVPGGDDDKGAKDIYEATKNFAIENCGPVTDRRIQKITFRDRKKVVEAEVGKIEPIVGETVVAILEGNPYLVCTPNRGVLRGQPILVGKQEIISITDFDS